MMSANLKREAGDSIMGLISLVLDVVVRLRNLAMH
jgi:hypothetical protein